ncbi:MAG: outer membrane protein assembly factor BamD [Bacteroidetes bacterium]|nr:outer membrane protein assembly factor BamD [Bacteroidota bacterium]
MNFRIIVGFIFVAVTLTSCSEYQKALRKNDIKQMYELANSYYEAGDYVKAKRLYEVVAPKYAGRPQGERLNFFFANANFLTGTYFESSYQFERFIKAYPNSDKREEASFLEAASYYKMSPRFSLDQTDTDTALQKLQSFINDYPDSEYFESANEMVQTLNVKKQQKAFEIAKQYDKLGEFNLPVLFSSITSMNNFIQENPGSIYREEAYFIRLKSATILAQNSTFEKMSQRFNDALKYYNEFKKNYPNSRFSKEAETYKNLIDKSLTTTS